MSINNTKTGGQNAYQFIDLVDVPAFARLLERFFQATGIPNGIVDTNGELLSMSSGENACSVFHRTQSEAADLCRDSNLELVRDLRDGCVAGGLCRNGLMDYATPVVVEGRQLATLFLGQVLHAPPDMAFFRAQATRFGFDEKTYLESIAAIPIVDKKHVDDLMAVMVEMAQMLAASGLAKLKQTELERDINVHAERNIQLRDILDFSPVAMGWSENEDRIEYVNRQFTLLFGYTVADLPNLETWYQRAYPDENYRKTVVGPWRRAVAQAQQTNKRPPELEADITCKDGSVRSIIIRVAWIGNHRMASFTDITERKQMEEQLLMREREFRTLAENLPDNIARWDTDGRYLYINPTHERTLEVVAADVIGRPIPESHDRVKSAIAQVAATGQSIYLLRQDVLVDGEMQIHEVNLVPEFDAEGRVISVLGLGRDMTDIRRLQETITAREQEFRSLAESSPDVVIRVDLDLRIRYLNTNMVKFLELGSAEEVIGRPCSELWPDGRFNEIDALRERVVATGEMESIAVVVPVLGGKKAYHHVISVPERDIDGHIIGTITFGRDITAIREIERRLNSLVENLPGVAYTIRRSAQGELNFSYVSAGVKELYGITPEAAMGEFAAMHGLVHPDDKVGMETAFAESARTMTPFRVEVRICPLGLPERWLDVRSNPEAQPDGSILWYGLIFDITERKRMEDALRVSEVQFRDHDRLLQAVLESSPDVIVFALDRAYRYLAFNDKHRATMQAIWGKEIAVGTDMLDVIGTHPDREKARQGFDCALSGEAFVTEDAYGDEAILRLYWQNFFAPIRGEDGSTIGLTCFVLNITERKRMEQVLAERERELRTLVENLPDNIARYTTDARHAYVSPSLERIFHEPKENFLGRTPTQCSSDAGNVEVERRIRAVVATGVGDEMEYTFPISESETRCHLIRFVAERDDANRITGVLGIGTDITERRRMELNLAAREREFRTLAEHLPDVVVRYDREARFVYVNTKFEAAIGFGLAEVRGKSPTQVPGLPDAEYFEQTVRRVAETGTPIEFERAMALPDGRTIYGLVHVTPEFDDAGEVEFIQVLTSDITAQKRAEAELRDSEEKLRGLYELSSMGIALTDMQGNYLEFNDAFYKICGYKPEELNQLDYWALTPKEYEDKEREQLELLHTVGHYGPYEKEYIRKDGSRIPLRLNGLLFRDLSGKAHIWSIVEDITERKLREQRIHTQGLMLEMVARGTNLPDILNAIVRYMESKENTSLCSILLVDADGKHLLTGAAPSLPAFYNAAVNGIEIGSGISICCAALGQRVVVEDIVTDEYWRPNVQLELDAGLRSCWSEPILSSRGKVLGTLSIYHAEPKSPQLEDNERIAFAANLAAIAIENSQARDELERQAHSDYLTGLENRRHFLSQAENELARTLRYGRELSVMMLDVDHFKQVNDTYGHKVGDLVLKRLAELCRATLRDVDIVGRIGGEEFAVLLPETSSEHAKEAAERLCAEIASAQVKLDSGLPLRFTASFGVTTLCENDANIDILLDQADQALYRAKEEGRNRVCIYPEDERRI